MIKVIKRSGLAQQFDNAKLRLSIWRAMGGNWDTFSTANHYSQAIELFLQRNNHRSVSSGALFEMAVRTLTKSGDTQSAKSLEYFAAARQIARKATTVLDTDGNTRHWNRNWLTRQIMRRWDLSEQAASAISAEVESEIIFSRDMAHEEDILEMADELVENYGLAPWCLLAALPGK